jgi:hypothetical protein
VNCDSVYLMDKAADPCTTLHMDWCFHMGASSTSRIGHRSEPHLWICANWCGTGVVNLGNTCVHSATYAPSAHGARLFSRLRHDLHGRKPLDKWRATAATDEKKVSCRRSETGGGDAPPTKARDICSARWRNSGIRPVKQINALV